MGPSGCGKSTFIKIIFGIATHYSGNVEHKLDGVSINNIPPHRRGIGMVFQKPNPFPKSIYENVAYGLRLQGVNDRSTLDKVVEKSLKGAALWDEVKDRLQESAMGMSGGQQQRLVIARAIAIEPEVLLWMSHAALDPIATARLRN